MTASLFDIFLSLTLLFLAWQLLGARDLFVSVALFIVFGLLMALAWVQLRAPDIALVEAAIGAGLTGALFLGALGRMEANAPPVHKKEASDGKRFDAGLLIAVGVLTAVLGWCLLSIPIKNPGLTGEVVSKMPRSGVDNPVTAVILNFRAYDTMLEIGVLLLVAFAVTSLFKPHQRHFSQLYFSSNAVLTTFLQLMVPFLSLLALYFLWVGNQAPGGAFQAGSILGGTGILMLLGGIDIPINSNQSIWRVLLSLGFGSFILTGIAVISGKRSFLEYPQGLAKPLILLIESFSTVSIAVIFISLFKLCSGFTPRRMADRPESGDAT